MTGSEIKLCAVAQGNLYPENKFSLETMATAKAGDDEMMSGFKLAGLNFQLAGEKNLFAGRYFKLIGRKS